MKKFKFEEEIWSKINRKSFLFAIHDDDDDAHVEIL